MLQLRADVFNVFNASIINARQTTLQMNNPIDQVIQNASSTPTAA